MVTNQPNVKEIAKRAYTSYHQDGLLDIFVGVYIIAFDLGIFMDVLWELGFGVILAGSIPVAVMLPMWIAAKRKITMPRIGFVKFGPQSIGKLMGVLVGTALAGLGVVFALTVYRSGNPLWLDLIFQNGLLVVGISSLALSVLFGYAMGLKRLYAYGLVALIVFAVGQFMGIFFAYLLLILGIAVTVTGCVLLVDFVEKYPLQGEKAIAE